MKKNLNRKIAFLFVGLVLIFGALSIFSASAASNSFNIGITVEAPSSPVPGPSAVVLDYVSYDIDGDGQLEIANDSDSNASNGFEVFTDSAPVGTPSTVIAAVDGDGDGKIDYLIDISGDGKPDRYWDPDDGILTNIGSIDVDGDGRDEFAVDTNGDGIFDKYYDPDTGTLSNIPISKKLADIDGDGMAEGAYNNDANSSNGFEVFVESNPVGTPSTVIAAVDGDGDGKIDYLIDISGDGKPDRYWDPDDDILTNIGIIDIDGDSRDEFLIDNDNDGTFEMVYDPDTGILSALPNNIVFRDIDNDGRVEKAENNDSNISNGYEIFSDPDASSTVYATVDGDGDGKIDYLIDVNGDGKPDVYWDPDDNILTILSAEDVDIDGTMEYKIDIDGNGVYEKYYDPDTGAPVLALKAKEKSETPTIPSGQWTPTAGTTETNNQQEAPQTTQPSEDSGYPIKLSLSTTNNKAKADGKDSIKINVKATDSSGVSRKGLKIFLESDNTETLILPETYTTNAEGMAYFTLTSKVGHSATIQAKPKDSSVAFLSNTLEVSFESYQVQPVVGFLDKIMSLRMNALLKAIASKVLTPLMLVGLVGISYAGIISSFGSLAKFLSIFSVLFAKRKKDEDYVTYYRREEEKNTFLLKLRDAIRSLSTILLIIGTILSLVVFWINTGVLNGVVLALYLVLFTMKNIALTDLDLYPSRTSLAKR